MTTESQDWCECGYDYVVDTLDVCENCILLDIQRLVIEHDLNKSLDSDLLK